MKSKNWNMVIFIGLIITLYGQLVWSVEIRELKVPELVELSPEDIVLDCDFDYDESEKSQLDIKWYFNDEPSPFYQWIPSSRAKPQLIGDRFARHIDLSHTVLDEVDELKRHRALLIKEPTVELSGTYTCKVSTFLDEDVQHKKMVIYSPATSVTFRQQTLPSSDGVNVSCAATGVYPQPQIKLLRGSYQLDDSEASVTRDFVGYFDMVVHRVVDHADIPRKSTFSCELTIPGTDYRVREQAVYQHNTHGGYSKHAAFASSSKSLEFSTALVVTSMVLLLV